MFENVSFRSRLRTRVHKRCDVSAARRRARPTLALALLVAGTPHTARGTEPTKCTDKTKCERKRETNDADIMLGATFDTGTGQPSQGSTSLGLRATRVHLFGIAWVGYGGDARVVTTHFDSVDAGLMNLVVRAGIIGPNGFVELEGLLGVGIAGMPIPTWGFAGLIGLPWFGVGVSFQFPIAHNRPVWLEEGQIAIRLQMPLEPCKSRIPLFCFD